METENMVFIDTHSREGRKDIYMQNNYEQHAGTETNEVKLIPTNTKLRNKAM